MVVHFDECFVIYTCSLKACHPRKRPNCMLLITLTSYVCTLKTFSISIKYICVVVRIGTRIRDVF